jgi:hypothetical protein
MTMTAPIRPETASGQASMPVRHDQIDRIVIEWLPDELYANIQSHEHRNFVNLVEAVEAFATLIPDTAAACANQDAVLAADPLILQIQTCDTLLVNVCPN